MDDSNALRTLKRKREEIEAAILMYEDCLARARRDLSHIAAVITVFEAGDLPGYVTPYTNLHAIFRRGEIARICKDALAQEGPLDTRELAIRVCRAKGLNEADKPLKRTLAYKIVQALTMQMKRGALESAGKRAGVRVWRAKP
jgi:hypothetical protein